MSTTTFVLETRDVADGQIGPETTVADIASHDAHVAHPLTSPVLVQGAQPGVCIPDGAFMGTAGVAPPHAQLDIWACREADLVIRGGLAQDPTFMLSDCLVHSVNARNTRELLTETRDSIINRWSFYLQMLFFYTLILLIPIGLIFWYLSRKSKQEDGESGNAGYRSHGTEPLQVVLRVAEGGVNHRKSFEVVADR